MTDAVELALCGSPAYDARSAMEPPPSKTDARSSPTAGARSGWPLAHEWLLIALGLALVWRYAWVMDDGFIYARYADNAVLTRVGLVYNLGEYVEGYSSPLWMLWLLIPRALGLTFWHIWLGTGLLCFAWTGWLLVRLDRRLAPPESADARARVNLPLAFLAACYGVTCFYTSGLESPFVQLVAVAYALLLVDPRDRAAQVLVGLSPLVRPELALPFALALGVVALRTWRGRRSARAALRAILLPAALGVTTQLGWLSFRLYYYADLLPNTFYLKHERDPVQGWRYFVNAFYSYHVELLLLLAGLALWLAWRRRGAGSEAPRLQLRARLWMLLLALPVALYVIRIGGDAMHFRFLAFPFVLVVCATAGALELAFHTTLRGRLGARRLATLCALTSLVVAGLSLLQQPPQRRLHALRGPGSPNMVHKISDAGRHRRRPKLRKLALWREDLAARREAGRHPERFAYEKTVAIDWCATAHWRFRWRVVHSLGLTEATLARMPIPADRPGHRYGLNRYADDLARIYNHPDAAPGRGMLRAAVEGGYAPRWVERELEALERVEKKVFNQHNLRENLSLALSTPRRLDPRARPRGGE